MGMDNFGDRLKGWVSGEKPKAVDTLGTVLSIAADLAQASKGLSKEQIQARPDIIAKAQALQSAIDSYKQAAARAGEDPQVTKQNLIKEMQRTGLTFGMASESESKLKGFDINSSDNKWKNITENIIALEPRDPKIVAAVEANLTSKDVVFRMMSKSEFQAIMKAGVIGKVSSSQIESGTTWWGDRAINALSQRGDKVRQTDSGQTWGGADGVMIAIKRSAIEPFITEKRNRNIANPKPNDFDAYKTRGEISIDQITDVFNVTADRDAGFYKVEKLIK